MWIAILVSFFIGLAIPITIALLIGRYLAAHPNIIMSYMGRKIAREIKTVQIDNDANI